MSKKNTLFFFFFLPTWEGDDELLLKSSSASSVGILDLHFPLILSRLNRNMALANSPFPLYFFLNLLEEQKLNSNSYFPETKVK